MAALQTAADRTTQVPNAREVMDTTQIATNKTAGVLTEGVANLFDGAVKGTYNEIKRQAEKSFQSGYDEVNDKFGVSDAALNSRLGLPVKDALLDTRDDGSSPPDEGSGRYDSTSGTSDATDFSGRSRTQPSLQELPVPAERTLNRVQRIQRANEAGKLSPSEYNASMEAEVRRVRAEYPGFRDEIDAKVREITGITPANALRASMLRDQIALQRADSSGAAYERNYRKTNDKYVAPGEENLPFPEYRAKVVAAQQQEHQVTTASARLSLDVSNGKNVGTRAEQVVTQGLTGEADKIMAPAMKPIQELIDRKVASKQGLSVDEIQNLRPAVAKMKLALENSFEQWLDRPSDYDPAHPDQKGRAPTFRTLINDPNKVAAMKADYVGRAKAYEQSLTDEHFGILNYQKLFAEGSREAADSGLMQQGGMATLAVVNKQFGPAVANIVVADTSNGTPVLPTIQQAILKASKLNLVAPGGKSPADMKAELEATAKKPGAEPITAAAYRAQISGMVQTMTNKDLPDEAKTNAINSVVHDMKYIYTFKAGAGQREVYSTLSSPTVTDSVAEQAVANPKVWTEYKGAAIRNFVGVYRSAAIEAGEIAKAPGYDLKFDDKSNQFVVMKKDGQAPDFSQGWEAGNSTASYQRRVDQLNEGIRGLSYILGKDKEPVGPRLLQMSKAMGVDLDAPKEDFLSNAWQAIKVTAEKVDKAVTTDGKRASDKVAQDEARRDSIR